MQRMWLYNCAIVLGDKWEVTLCGAASNRRDKEEEEEEEERPTEADNETENSCFTQEKERNALIRDWTHLPEPVKLKPVLV